MTIEHVIVVRVRKNRIVLSVNTLRMTTLEQLTWVSEDGDPFSIHFKHGKKPFGGNGEHESQGGSIKATPAPPAITHSTPYNYTVKKKGYPDLDPRIVFEIPPTKTRE